LIVVSGSPGSGKTTLAHLIARAIPCPAICRDEIREGLVDADARRTDDDTLAKQTNAIFFDVVTMLVERSVTLVAEAAFQHKLWAPKLEPLRDVAQIRVIRCRVDPDVARARIAQRAADPLRQRSHPDAEYLARIDSGEISFSTYDPISMDVPTLVVDTRDGYDPALEVIVGFVRS
jgi:predicted kinase